MKHPDNNMVSFPSVEFHIDLLYFFSSIKGPFTIMLTIIIITIKFTANGVEHFSESYLLQHIFWVKPIRTLQVIILLV